MVNRVNKMLRHSAAIKQVANELIGPSLLSAGRNRLISGINTPMPGYKKGGKVKKTGHDILVENAK